ncbi:unnamed protein product [Toxocara canis]|uniref:Transporter n=1 Tax=Toxocara canis TaxID=6265 RepID=A0A183V9J2_TOXCA|nr:unnamed protein product [Toxocara canis]
MKLPDRRADALAHTIGQTQPRRIGGFFWLTMMLVVALNAANGVYQNSLFGIAADLPPNVTASIMIGNNLCGAFCAVVAMIILRSCLLLSTVPWKRRFQAFYQYHVNKVGKRKVQNEEGKEGQDDSKGDADEGISSKLSDYCEVIKTVN